MLARWSEPFCPKSSELSSKSASRSAITRSGSKPAPCVLRPARHGGRAIWPTITTRTTLSDRSGSDASPAETTRVVFDLDGVVSYSVFSLYNPYRSSSTSPAQAAAEGAACPYGAAQVTSWTETSGGSAASTSPRSSVSGQSPPRPRPRRPAPARGAAPAGRDRAPGVGRQAPGVDAERVAAGRSASRPTSSTSDPSDAAPDPARAPDVTVAPGAPAAPAKNTSGGFSLARQLGLGVSRIVIDPGHGGHDPGAMGKRVSEAQLVLDVALRLEKLLEKQAGFEVVLTRRTGCLRVAGGAHGDRQSGSGRSVPVDPRQCQPQRKGARRRDLLPELRDQPRGRGGGRPRERGCRAAACTTCPISCGPSPSTTSSTSRATSPVIVQNALVLRLRAKNPQVRDLGVKQAPFVVLIGASMPSVLAEIAFVTNRRSAAAPHPSAPAESRRVAVRRHRRVPANAQVSLDGRGPALT